MLASVLAGLEAKGETRRNPCCGETARRPRLIPKLRTPDQVYKTPSPKRSQVHETAEVLAVPFSSQDIRSIETSDAVESCSTNRDNLLITSNCLLDLGISGKTQCERKALDDAAGIE